VDGRAGLRELRSRLFRWRVGARWYAVAVLTTPLSVTATLLLLSVFSSEFLPGYLVASDQASLPSFLGTDKISLLLISIALGLVTGFLEELGWTGFAIPRLKLRYGVFALGSLMGLLWGAWHLVSNLAAIGSYPGPLFPALYLAVLLFSFLPPYRVLMVWVYDRTESLLVAMLMHASLVAFWLFSTPQGITSGPQMVWYLVWAGLLWAAVAGVAVLNSRRLSLPRWTDQPDLMVRRAA
jgi:uncharacterized protein